MELGQPERDARGGETHQHRNSESSPHAQGGEKQESSAQCARRRAERIKAIQRPGHPSHSALKTLAGHCQERQTRPQGDTGQQQGRSAQHQ